MQDDDSTNSRSALEKFKHEGERFPYEFLTAAEDAALRLIRSHPDMVKANGQLSRHGEVKLFMVQKMLREPRNSKRYPFSAVL